MLNFNEADSIKIDSKDAALIKINDDVVWPIEELGNYIKFMSENNVNFLLKHNFGSSRNLEYSYDTEVWNTWNGEEISSYDESTAKNYPIYVRGTSNSSLDTGNSSTPGFVFTATNGYAQEDLSILCSGNIENLLDYQTVERGSQPTIDRYCFRSIFRNTPLKTAPELPSMTLNYGAYYYVFTNCRQLIKAPALPATRLFDYVYAGMFGNCTSLTTAPALPATEKESVYVHQYCYASMFAGCTSLVNAPELPFKATTPGMYYHMFEGCTSLVNAPELPAKWVQDKAYQAMFKGCTSLVNAPELPATKIDYFGCDQMFAECTSLVNVPDLVVTTFDQCSCQGMFAGCTSLVNAPALPATTVDYNCYESMFEGCTSLVNAPELPATTLARDCYRGMFKGCTSLVNAPELPATALQDYCYINMFTNCTNLTTLEVNFTNWRSSGWATKYWVENVGASGTFKCPRALPIEYGADRIPENWTVEYID